MSLSEIDSKKSYSKLMIPISRRLFEPINGLAKSANSGVTFLNEALRYFHVDLFIEVSMKESIINF